MAEVRRSRTGGSSAQRDKPAEEQPAQTDAAEYECKLGGPKAALAAVKKVVSQVMQGPVRWTVDELESVYFDTPDMRLGSRRTTLRVRRKNEKFIQNVKSKNDAGGALFARGEWEQEVDGLLPNLEVLPEDAINCLGLVLPGELREIFRTKFRRERAILERGGGVGPVSRIEIALDQGDVIAGAASEPISEVELELVEGELRDLFEVALELQQAAGLGLVQETKAARGYRLLRPSAPTPVKSVRLTPNPEQSVNATIAETLRAGMRQMVANEAAARDGNDPEGVHQFRVAIRRMRSVLSLFSKLLQPARVAWLKDELKWAADQFGPARDWDVFISEVAEPVRAAGVEEESMQALLGVAAAARAEAYELVRDTLSSPRYASMVLKLSAFTEMQGWSPQPCPADHPLTAPIAEVAPEILDKVHKKTRKAGRGLAEMDTPRRHQLRIRIKKLRYPVDFLQALFDAPGKKRYLKSLARLQNDFGHLNDVAVAEELLGELIASHTAGTGDAERSRAALGPAAGAILGWYARGLQDQEPHLLSDWDAFTEAAPFWRSGGGLK